MFCFSKCSYWTGFVVSCWAIVAIANPLDGLTISPTDDPTHFKYEYKPPSGEAISGFLALPKGAGPFRVVVVNHSPIGNASQAAYNYAPPFLDRGYATITVDLIYAKTAEASDFPQMFRRIQESIEIIEHDDRFDTKQIYMFGNGPGAMVTLAFATQTDKLKAIALTGAGILPKGGFSLEKLATPVIMVHGETDQTVPLEAALQLKANLERAGKTVELTTIKNSGHEVVTLKKADVFDAIVEFFHKHAK